MITRYSARKTLTTPSSTIPKRKRRLLFQNHNAAEISGDRGIVKTKTSLLLLRSSLDAFSRAGALLFLLAELLIGEIAVTGEDQSLELRLILVPELRCLAVQGEEL